METAVQQMLDTISSIIQTHEEFAKKTGENFNIFRIMKMEEDEVYMHSSIIAELLNTKGSHGFGHIFLEKFIEQLKKTFPEFFFQKFDFSNTYISTEKYIGEINAEKTEGGRIDILIETPTLLLLFENKINAINQENQLLRYYNYAKTRNKDFIIIYLSKLPEDSKEKTTYKYINITYRDFIKEWIEMCIQQTKEKPFINEILKQYLNTVKTITYQSTNIEMEQKIVNEIIKNTSSLDAAFSIWAAINKPVKEELFRKMKEQLCNCWAIQQKYIVSDDNWGWSDGASEVSFTTHSGKAKIILGFEKKFNGFTIRVKAIDASINTELFKNKLGKKLIDKIGDNEYWEEYLYVYQFDGKDVKNEDWRNWDWRQFVWKGMIDAKNGRTITQLKKWIEQIREILEE